MTNEPAVEQEFKREPRYIVFKISDMTRYCLYGEYDTVVSVGKIIEKGRRRDGKPPFNAVVVEQDWPEFEPTWAAIEARMTGRSSPISGGRQMGVEELLRQWQTELGSCRDACDQRGKRIWDRIEAVLATPQGVEEDAIAALTALTTAKEYKDTVGKDAAYVAMRQAAWEQAYAVLKLYNGEFASPPVAAQSDGVEELAVFIEWAGQVAQQWDVPPGIRKAAQQLHDRKYAAPQPTRPAQPVIGADLPSSWWSALMCAAADLETASNFIHNDPAAKRQALGACEFARNRARSLWDESCRPEVPAQEIRNAALEEAAQLLYPKNPVSDWTEWAREGARHATRIRALKSTPTAPQDTPAQGEATTGCACRWLNDECVAQCEVHKAWAEELHEWAEIRRSEPYMKMLADFNANKGK